MKKASSSTNVVDDLSSIFGGRFENVLFIDAIAVSVFVLLLTWLFLSLLFYGLKQLHHLDSFRKLKGKMKKGEEPDWNASRELRSVRYVLLQL